MSGLNARPPVCRGPVFDCEGGNRMNTLRIGIAGLGRLGRVHAENIACKIPGARLTAACTTRPETLEYARQLG